MILNLNDPFFAKDPFEVYRGLQIEKEDWNKIWYKKKFLEYRLEELVEYINVIMHKPVSRKQLSRCLMRYEVFLRTQSLIKRHEQTVHINYYPDNIKSFIKDYYHGKQQT